MPRGAKGLGTAPTTVIQETNPIAVLLSKKRPISSLDQILDDFSEPDAKRAKLCPDEEEEDSGRSISDSNPSEEEFDENAEEPRILSMSYHLTGDAATANGKMEIDFSDKMVLKPLSIEEAIEKVDEGDYCLPFSFGPFMGDIQNNLTNFLYNGAIKHQLTQGKLGDEVDGDYSNFLYTADDPAEVSEWFDGVLKNDKQALVNFTAGLKKEDIIPGKFTIELTERGSPDEADTYWFDVYGHVKLDGHLVGISRDAFFYWESDMDALVGEPEGTKPTLD